MAVAMKELEGRLNTQKALMEEAQRNIESRLEVMNGLRAEMAADKNRYLTRVEWTEGHRTLENKYESLQTLMYTKLGRDFEARVEERFAASDKRSGFTERMIWMAMGAIALISLLLRFVGR